jgi:glutamine cyclotransferase
MRTLTIFAVAVAAGLVGPVSAHETRHPERTTVHPQVSRDRIRNQQDIPIYDYRVVKTYPHDTTSYTEGLQLVDGRFYEGTGRYGMSAVRVNDIPTGEAIKRHLLLPLYFGEGIVVLKDEIYALTFASNTGFVYDRETVEPLRKFTYPGQGWGLTTDGTHILMSDGSSLIRFLDPDTLETVREVYVTDDVGPVGFLNELEYVDGTLYANVWQMDFIVAIDPETGNVTGWIDLSGLNPDPEKLVYPYVLNGIAYNAATGRLIVTGKCWPKLWEIELVERQR